MFEEVPRVRGGLGRLTAFRIALGPFVIGGGLLAATVGGSVAVAATVITASSINAPAQPSSLDVPAPIAPASSTPAAPAPHPSRPVSGLSWSEPTSFVPGGPMVRPSGQHSGPVLVPGLRAVVPAGPSSSADRAAPSSAGSPSPSGTGPAGNALIFVTGYDQRSNRITFEFAQLRRGTGAGGAAQYLVSDPSSFSAGIATGISITSGGQLCPPAGSRCTLDQLIAGAGKGFFATAAIDPAAQLQSIIELDNPAASDAAPLASASATPSASPSG
jgi:hypothetical protein